MKTVFWFDLQGYFKRWGFYVVVLLIFAFGVFGGQNARFSVGENVFYNSPYQVGFITAFISLTTIFFSTLFVAQLAIKEVDNRFEQIYFSAPIQKKQFLSGRYASVLIVSLLCTIVLTVSFFIGQATNSRILESGHFNLTHYLVPMLYFTVINTIFVTAVLCVVAWFTKSKMPIYVSGLLLYIFYMVALVFSSSPFMAQSLPQSEKTKFISGILDPFGLSAFFNQTAQWTVEQRNSAIIGFDGVFLGNRAGALLMAFVLLYIAFRDYSFTAKTKYKKVGLSEENQEITAIPFTFVDTKEGLKVKMMALVSFVKINLIYIFKSIPFVLIVLALLFAVGMEMYAEIEKGIRIPQKYATSGLMVSTIIQNFYVLGVIVVVFYTHDVFWRSKNVNFNLIENSTSNAKTQFWAHWLTLLFVIASFSLVLIVEGIAFQFLYGYPVLEWSLYSRVLLFTTLPLFVLSGFLLAIQKLVRQKYVALGLAALFAFVMATSLGKKLVAVPFLKFLYSINFDYSDMNGFGSYEGFFIYRLMFGFLLLAILFYVVTLRKFHFRKVYIYLTLFVLGLSAFGLRHKISEGYLPKDENSQWLAQADYEKQFSRYQNLPQPTITDVKTTVELFPERNSYTVEGTYILENKTERNIEKILIGFSDGFMVAKADFQFNYEVQTVVSQYQIVKLKQSMLPREKAKLTFKLSYRWQPVNGHQSFNAIVENGSFMRISRYYPQIGYNSDNEIQEESIRKQFHLGAKTEPKAFNAPKGPNVDFINLDMTIVTSDTQTAIGMGELVRQWKKGNRNGFQYQVKQIPFRFAVSSAEYAVKKEQYKGKTFEVYYHPSHHENVQHLLKNAKLTMDYCEHNFGPYPYKTIRFAEVSGFTKGFAATAYPATVYMTEDMIFHSNIKADEQQDVINELAGHELAHLWWGGNQIVPDDRDGAAMLTETLAMYTEMMLLKKMYGKEAMLKRVQMHLDIYNNERGFSNEMPLYHVKANASHISYSKGAIVMCLLSEMIGEDKMNLALKRFLQNNKFPNPKPVSTDFIAELYKVSDKKYHAKIESLFTKIEPLKESDLRMQ
ncbi:MULTISPECIES: ABC transporter permease/M1 family aminopeptidase [Flavobacterium]|uniref:ABC transporter permease/M1 family aminopeptidase n=1 Tax=Flavobacterium TaxID=237 RepID=UPI001FCCB711|nr:MULTISPECIES: M1 family aminopeptidase [Flavobacterium]UOK41390.1 ABC-2 transporter permease [Flavobacterium enshiense]